MDHQVAIDTQAAERYMLAEMNEAERDAFEEHYFGCAVCADDVRALEALREGARDAAAAPAVSRRRSPFAQILPWAAAASLLLVVGYQQLVRIPRLTADIPAVMVAQRDLLLTGETRSEDAPALAANAPAIVAVEVVHDPQFESYGYELRRTGGPVLASGPITAAQVQQSSVSLLVRSLPAGSYEVVIEGVRKEGNRSPVSRYSFVVK